MTASNAGTSRRGRMDVSIGDVKDQTREYREAVLAMPMHERLELVERLRQMRHGPNYAAERLLRVLTIVEPGEG